MSQPLVISLKASAEQSARLQALQRGFAEVCNALAPIARDSRCWNRVALHHMTYRDMREKFPQMGSQMVCNAIYSVSRTCRVVYQAPASPFNLNKWGARRLPLIQFSDDSPVYFDRHTLSIKEGHLSMFTLDGRMRFELQVSAADEKRFHDEKLAEIVLLSRNGAFSLMFTFAAPDGATAADGSPEDGPTATDLPEYVVVSTETESSTPGDAQ